MYKVSGKVFDELMSKAIDAIPEPYAPRIQNVAFLIEDEPSPQQRVELSLRPEQSLFGLYQGTPLPKRFGTTKLLPDKITLFKIPLESASTNFEELKENIRHTLWHEVAHYFGLDHEMIYKLEK